MKKYKIIVMSVVAALVALIVALVVLNFKQKNEMKEMVELMEFEKELLEDEYEEFAMQFDGYRSQDIHNDSLVALLSKEQQRVQDLLEELRITKATSARRIAELKKELATVRAVMVSYVQQIDSLDRTNKQLVQENKQVKQQYQQVTRQNQELEKERTILVEKVTLASMLEISDFTATFLDKRDRKTGVYGKIMKLQFDYTIARNITIDPGHKTIYLRLTRPDGEVMQKSIHDVFDFENSKIAYSIAKEFEYEGEEVSGAMYWTVEEVLQKGIYNADFFVDGQLIGSFPFELD